MMEGFGEGGGREWCNGGVRCKGSDIDHGGE